ncbi:MAG TPA: VWA domain-containing protein, partial [Gemmataceae bacterium]|nr:VWA domain-containing protein [Gemmataceae bacterium]
AGLPLGEFRSSLHSVLTEETGNGVRRIVLQPGERLNRDFILRFRVGAEAVKTALSIQPDPDGDGATLMLTLVPPMAQSRALRPRDVAFVLDRSGSMGGWKIVAARRALARMVDTLNDKDRFAVYAFDHDVETPPDLPDGLTAATDRSRFRAVEFLAKIEARGGTEMAKPLDIAVRELAGTEPGRDRVLVLVTDGQVGQEDQILRTLGARIHDVRVFTLGIDQAVNEGFLRRLAALGGGSCEVVESEDRLDEVMDKVHRRIGTPVFTGLRLEADGLGIDPDSLVPARMPDLFAGAPLSIMGRCRQAAAGPVVLHASDVVDRPWSETVQASLSDNAAISCVWARGHIRELEDRFVLGRVDRGQVEKRIVRTSLKFGVLCRFTAFVAIDTSEVVNKGGEVHSVIQPVDAPEGWAMLGTDRARGIAPLCQTATASMACFQDGVAAAESGQVYRAQDSTLARSVRLIRKLLPSRGGKTPAPVPTPEPADLTAYRKRAFELLEQIKASRGAATAERLVRLQLLAVKLAELIQDLKSVRTPAAEIRPLEKLVDELRQLLTRRQPDEAALAQFWAQAEQVLEAFATKSGTVPAHRRQDFWK